MKTLNPNLSSRVGWLAAALLSIGTTAWSADITLKDAYRDYFYMGVAINRTIATDTAVRADNVNRTLEQVEKDIALVKAQFNQISPENDLKWALIHPRPGAEGYNFAPADAFVNFGVSNNMYIVGHTLVWHAQTPDWVFEAGDGTAAAAPAGTASAAGPAAPPATSAAAPASSASGAAPRGGRRGFGGRGRGPTGPLATRDQLLQRMHDHIQTVVGRYKGKIKVWDVVNEALGDGGNTLRNSYWRQIIGPDFIAKAFQYAHEADPDAILRYNDYGLEGSARRNKLLTLIKQLQEQKIPVGAIGSQTHIGVGTSFDTIDKELTELETLGLPIHITELDINGAQGGQGSVSGDIAGAAARTQGGMVSDADRRQMNAYSALFRALIKHKNSVKVVTFWGANDGVSWQARGRPLLFDGNDQPKPAFDAVIHAATGESSK